MKLDEKQVRRCGIFLFFDKDGVVDDYIQEMLRDLQENVSYLLVVCNGYVEYKGLEKLRDVSDDVICRANVGFDVGGYREGIFYLGWKYMENYDEIVMMNYTFFGPIYPFSEMFQKMAEKDISFWGITKHHKVEPDPFHALPYGYLPEHIQSHFLVLRKDLFMSYQYRDFICNMKNPQTYLESICGYEAIFTKYFSDLGFEWDVYVDSSEYEGYSYNPLMFYTKNMLHDKRCPIIKRRSFFTDYSDYLLNTCGEASTEMYDYLVKNNLYNLDLIWDNILRLENISAVQRVLHLNYILDSDVTAYNWNKKVAVIIFADSIKRCKWYKKYLESIPVCIDVYIYGSQEVCEKISGMCVNSECIYILGDTAGEFGHKLSEAISVINMKQYGYVGIADMKNVEKARPYSNEVSWQYSDWENLFGNAQIIGNMLQEFESNNRMGLCIPPIPFYGSLQEKIGYGWCGKFQQVEEYLNSNKVFVNINEKENPLVPYGGSFWIRGDLLQKLLEFNLNIDEEVFLIVLPFLVQSMGGYTGICYSDNWSAVEVTNQDYMFRENNKVLFEKYGASFHNIVVERIRSGDLRKNRKE